MNLKSLAKDTAIYGLSSIVGKFLNYLLSILYLHIFPAETGGYGIVTNLYAWTALLLAFLTFGMETTLFRFSGKENENPETVFSTSLKFVAGLALAFVAVVFCFLKPISGVLGYGLHPDYIGCFALITALDAFQSVLFARLRQQKRPVKFMTLKLSFIFASIILNLIAFLVVPKMFGSFPGLESFYASHDGGVGVIFFINLFCTAMVTFGFIPELRSLKIGFDKALCKRMLKYAWPVMLLGVVGLMNQVADKILYPKIMPGQEGMVQLGIYGGCVKIAMVMAMLTQAFRYAYEPIVFGEARNKDSEKTLADGMKWFIIFSLLAFLGVMVWLPLLKHITDSSYWIGLGVIPVVMIAELFMGIYFNLSFWYKLTDQTWWGAIMNAVAVTVMITINIVFVPKIGYWACAWGGFAGYGIAMLLSWFIGQKKYPIKYDLRAIAFFFCLAAAIYAAVWALGRTGLHPALTIAFGTVLLLVYCLFVWKSIKPALKK